MKKNRGVLPVMIEIDQLGKEYIEATGHKPRQLLINKVDFEQLLAENTIEKGTKQIHQMAIYIAGSKVDLVEHDGELEFV